MLSLANGSYIVSSPHWSSVGSITWWNGSDGTLGPVSASNSLVNTCINDPDDCRPSITALPDGNASIHLPNWSNGSRYGAVSLVACGPDITLGPVSSAYSILGAAANKGHTMVSSYDATRPQLIVGRQSDNKVSILRCQPDPPHWLYLPVVLR